MNRSSRQRSRLPAAGSFRPGARQEAPAGETFLAFDYGERHIGVAVGQSITGTASPLSTLRVRGGQPDWTALGHLVAAWRPAGLVVGEPLHMDGRVQPMTRRARRFRQALAERFGLPVHAADERLTTVEARAELAARGAFRGAGERRGHRLDHPIAARILLESWLGERRPERGGAEPRRVRGASERGTVGGSTGAPPVPGVASGARATARPARAATG